MEKDKSDEEFIEVMLEVEKSYGPMSKHEKVRIEQWSKKLCQVTANPLWKKNRNKYAKSLLQLVKLGALQEPFNKIPPEGPLPQFTGQFYIQPPRPRPRSSAEAHSNRISTPIETSKLQDYKNTEAKSFELKPSIKNYRQNTEEKKINSESNLHGKVTFEKYDTRINITQKVNEDLVKLQTQVEIAQLNERHLREELSKKNKKVLEQKDEIEWLRRENENLKLKLGEKEQKKEVKKETGKKEFKYFLEKSKEEKEFLNIEDISDNLRRLERLQEDLNRNRFS